MRLYGTNLCINCTSSTRFAPSWQMHPNTMKTHQNMSLGSNGVDRVRLLPKIPMRVRGTNFCINCTSSAYSHRVSCNNETIQNAPKHYKTQQFMSLASNGVDRVRSLRKTLMRFRGSNFFFNWNSSTCFAPSFVQQRNKYKMHPNTTKRTNSCVQRPMSWIRCVRCENSDVTSWSGLCAFFAKNSIMN